MNYVLVDLADRNNFYPFSLTRSVAELRVGMFTFQQRWELSLESEASIFTEKYLQDLYANNDFLHSKDPAIFINITCLPNDDLVNEIKNLALGEKLMDEAGKWIATHSTDRDLAKILIADLPPKIVPNAKWVNNAVHLLSIHASIIQTDFNWIKAHRIGQIPDASNRLVNEANIFIEESATVTCSNLNATEGPIYIGKQSIIMEGVSIRGPFALGDNAVVKMNTSIYGATTIGPKCTAGGEIKNSIIMGYSNKAHEGYLGDSILGYWCNLGAGTSNSNIKNTAGKVQLWNENTHEWDTIGQKMGMLVGDYSRFAIQSSINTGSYIGVSANIFGNGLLPKNIPDFTWGILPGYQIEKAIGDIDNWKKLKGSTITEMEKKILTHLHRKIN